MMGLVSEQIAQMRMDRQGVYEEGEVDEVDASEPVVEPLRRRADRRS